MATQQVSASQVGNTALCSMFHKKSFRQKTVANKIVCQLQMFYKLQSCPKWSQMVPNGPKWSQMVPNGPKWSQMVSNVPKRSQMVPNGLKWSHIWVYMVIHGYLWVYMGISRQKMPLELIFGRG